MDANQAQIAAISTAISSAVDEAMEPYRQENEILREELGQVSRMFKAEDRGWDLISGLNSGEHVEGLDLDELKAISKSIRPYIVGDGMSKRGVDLHAGYVWNKGINFEGVLKEAGKRGPTAGLQSFYANAINQESIFSSTAHQELQKARYTDGNVYLACNTTDKTVRRIPLDQITAIKVNPEFPEEIWAYKRTWYPDGPTATNPRKRERWYYTNRIPNNKKQKSYTTGGETIDVEPNTVIVDMRFNRQIGYPLGIPDAVAAMPWIAAYEEIIQYGRVVSEALSRILFKVINKTKSGTNASAVKIANMTGHGNTASMVEGQDVAAIQSAGKGYDFISARPVASMAAMALNVPAMELLSDSSAAGSSYGAAQALTPSTKNAMRLMQASWIEMYEAVFAVFNLASPRIWFEPLEDPDLYRALQATVLGSAALSDEEYRGKVLDYLDIPGDPNKIPDILKTRTLAAQTAASPDQGVANGTSGGGQGANDQRTDGIGESLRREMAMEDIVRRFEAALDRAEALEHSFE